MQINEKIRELGQKLPRGYKNKIAKITSLSPNTVGNVFKGFSVRGKTLLLVLNAYDKVHKEEIAKEEEINKQIKCKISELL